MVWPAVIAAAAAVGGGILGNRAAASQASQARDFSAEQYATRYRTTMNDMRKAGLNPMLAYSQGVGTSPSGAMAAQGDFGGAAAGNIIAQSGIRSAQKKQAASQTNLNVSSAKNVDKDTQLKEQQRRESSSRTDKINQETATEFQRGILTASVLRWRNCQRDLAEAMVADVAAAS